MGAIFGGNNGAAAGATRPMPRPPGLGGLDVQSVPQKQQGGFLAQKFGPQGSEGRYEAAMQLLQAAMSGAAGSNSPALAFLTPLIGSAIGARATKLNEDYTASEASSMTEGLLGGPLSAEAQQAMDVLNNPNAPDYLKQIASSMFKDSVKFGGVAPRPSGRSGSGGKPRASGGGSPRPQKLTYIMRDLDGITRGYNAATGKREVIQNADAPEPLAAAAAPPAAAPMPADPTLPQDPMGDTDLINKYLGL